MPQTLLPNTLGDAVTLYQKTVVQPRKWRDLTRNFRHYYWKELTDRKLRFETPNSKTFTWSYMVGGYRNGAYDGFFEPDSLNRQNLGLTGEANWTFYKTHWAIDRREPSVSGGSPAMIANHIQMQEANCWTGVFEDGEEALWTLATYPNDGTQGHPVPWGIPYSVTSTSATSTVGQNGGHPTGYSSVYGNSRTAYPQLKNYNGTYSAVSDGDLCSQMEDMIQKTHWVAPKPSAQELEAKNDFEILSHYTPWKEYGNLLRTMNDNLGADAGRFRQRPGGTHMFMGFPWSWVDAITSQYLRDGVTANPCYNSAQPVYFLPWDVFDVVAATGNFMKTNPAMQLNDPHNTVVTWIDSQHQIVNRDPGQCGVLTRV